MFHALFVAFGAVIGIFLALAFLANFRAVMRFLGYTVLVLGFLIVIALGYKDMKEQEAKHAIEAASKSSPVAVPAVQVR